MYDLVQFLVLLSNGIAPNCEDGFNLGIKQAIAQDALPDHPRRPEKNHLHV